MSNFEKENRYYVIKRKYLTDDQKLKLDKLLEEFNLPDIECVCVESDWEIYDSVWDLIKQEAYMNEWCKK